MPKTDFSKSIIYKLCCKDPNITDEYIGSTTCFKQRKAQHKQNLKDDTKKDIRVYVTIREYGGWSNWDMIEVEKCSVNDRRELRARERYWIETLKPSLNCVLPQPIEEGLSEREWFRQYREDNREQIIKYRKKHYQKNREIVLENVKKYNEENREQIAKYHVEYYAKNKEIIVCECGIEVTKQHLVRHKKTKKHQDWEQGIITVIKGEQVECECGSIVTKNCLSRHRKTKKHQQFITSE